MRKGHDMSAFEEMVGTLSKSVGDLVVANPENIEELLAKNFSEFKHAVGEQLEAEVAAQVDLAKSAQPETEEPLFKGLGCVGRVANMFSSLVSQVEMIKEGLEYRGQSDRRNADPASEDVSTMLDHLIAMGELTLRAAVNEHVDISDDDEPEEGYHYIAVPSAEDPDDSSSDVVVKTVLPEDLAKFATDPGLIGQQIIELGAGLLLDGGLPQAQLEKLFAPGGETLAKTFPPAKKPAADGSDPAPAPQTADPTLDPSMQGDPSDGSGADPSGDGSDDSPLTVLGRILAAAMIQLDHIQQMVEGADPSASTDPAAADPNAGTAPSAAMTKAAPSEALAKLNEETAEQLETLRKSTETELAEKDAQLEQLRKNYEAIQSRLTRVESMPVPAKGVVNTAVTLTKGMDTGGSGPDDELAKEAARIDAMPLEKRQEALTQFVIKQQLRRPAPAVGVGALSGAAVVG
jgi:hypothetical protein